MVRILSIEDNPGQIESKIEGLSDCGHDIEKVVDISKAEEALKQNQYDVIFLNLTLPENGLSARLPDLWGMEGGVYILKMIERMKLSTPVIIYTNNIYHEVIRVLRAHNIKIPEILLKRYSTIDDLNDSINRMIFDSSKVKRTHNHV